MSDHAATPPPRQEHPIPTWSWIGAVPAAAALVVAFVLGARSWFYADDWNAFDKYADGSLLAPFNGHLSLIPAGVFSALYRTVGMDSYLPYRVVALVVLAVFAGVVWGYSVRRIGVWSAWLAVAALLWNASAASNLQFPFLINFSIPLIATVAMWWCLDNESTKAKAGAAVCLAVALASSGLGIMALVAAGVELIARRASWRQWLIMAPGPVLWAAWYAGNRESSPLVDDPAVVLRYAAGMAAGAARALGGGSTIGGVLAVVAVSLLVAGAFLTARDLVDWPRALAGLAAAAGFIVSTSLTRAETIPAIPPGELRYAWTISVYLVLALIGLWPLRGALPRLSELRGERTTAVIAGGLAIAVLLVAGGAVVSVGRQQDWVDAAAGAAPGIRSNLYAVEAVGMGRADPEWILPLSFEPVTSDGYLAAVAAVGSPIATVSVDQLGGDAMLRTTADRMLVEQLPIELVPADTCRTGPPTQLDSAGSSMAVAPGTEVLLVNNDPQRTVELRLARLADDAEAIVAALVPPGSHVLSIPADAPTASGPSIGYRLLGSPGLVAAICS